MMHRGAGRVVTDKNKGRASYGSPFSSRKGLDDSTRKDTLPRTNITEQKEHFPGFQIPRQIAANRLGLLGRLALTKDFGTSQCESSPSDSTT